MRIYDGSPRQDWEEVLRAIGRFADSEQIKELLFVELDDGFLLQALALPKGGLDSDSFGSLTKRTYELGDEQVAQLMEEATAERGSANDEDPHLGIDNYYEQAMRVVGAYVDLQHARDLFFLEQEGSFVLRLLVTAPNKRIGHRLAEFTKDEILAMIEAAPEQRGSAPAAADATSDVTSTGEAPT